MPPKKQRLPSYVTPYSVVALGLISRGGLSSLGVRDSPATKNIRISTVEMSNNFYIRVIRFPPRG